MGALQPISSIAGLSGIGAASSLSGAASIDALGGPNAAGATGGATGVGSAGQAGQTGQAGQGSFLSSLGDALGSLNSQLVSADASMADFAAGGSADLHTVLLQMQEASLGLKLGVQVRDKLVEAYQEIMRMQL